MLMKYIFGRNTLGAVLLFSVHPIRRLLLTIYLINGDANFVHFVKFSHKIFAHSFYYLLMVLNKNIYYYSGCQMVIFLSIFMPSTFTICHSAMKNIPLLSVCLFIIHVLMFYIHIQYGFGLNVCIQMYADTNLHN